MLNDLIDVSADLPVSSRFEPCAAFSAQHAGSPVCAGCGWLDGEHGGRAIVRRLPARPPATRRPRRLAS